MKNIYSYVKQYGNTSFKEEPVNYVDYAILTTVTYLFLDGIVPNDNQTISLKDALERFLELTDYKYFLTRGFDQKNLYNMAKKLVVASRYNTILLNNYIYKMTTDEQFSAVTMHLPNGIKYICYEGTDDNLIGWEEDFRLAYEYPIPAQIDAIKYINKNISLFDKEVIVGGHSKGGNLALVGAMNTNIFKRYKIKQIYSFDGPGLLKEQFYSKKYKKIGNKYCHIIPNYSIVGSMLYNNEAEVVKSSRIDIYAHSIFFWYIDDKEFVHVPLSKISKNLQKSIIIWLENHTLEERKKIVKDIFVLLNDLGFKTIMDLMKVKNIIKIVRNLNRFDDSTKKLLKDFVKFNFDYYLEHRKENEL